MIMEYFLISDKGDKSGPFTLEQLQEKINNSELGPAVLVEESEGGRQIYADQVFGLNWQVATTPTSQTDASPKRKKGPMVWLLVIGAIILFCGGITAVVLIPVFSQARLAAHKTESLSQARSVAVALMMYSTDYKDVYPPAGSSLNELLIPYLPTESKYSFSMLPDFAGTSATAITNITGQIVATGEPVKAGNETFYPVIFADGSADLLTQSEYQAAESAGFQINR